MEGAERDGVRAELPGGEAVRLRTRGGSMTKIETGEECPAHGAPASHRNSTRMRRLLCGAGVAAISMAMLVPAGAAFAQAAPAAGQAAPGQTISEIVVTGSRIARKDYTADSPIVTLNSLTLMASPDLQLQNTLNKMPQFTADQNLMGTNTGDTQPTPTHSVGISTASLRGLGPNRNLVLIDGQRGAPVNGELVIDLNTIPAAMVDRVETITGGASAVYGADAIGGVVNFIMKKNFSGLELDAQESINQTGDGKTFSFNALKGINWGDGKGNLTVDLERYQSDASLEKNHNWIRKAWNDPTVGSGTAFPFGTGYTGSGVTAAAVASVFPNAPAGSIPTTTIFWMQGNSIYTGQAGSGSVAPGGVSQNPHPIDGVNYAYQNAAFNGQTVKLVKTNETVGYIQAPLDRWSMFANGHYDFNDYITATFQGNFSRTHTSTIRTAYPTTISSGWTVNVPYDAATNGVASGHPVPTGLATLLNSRPNPNAPWTLIWYPSVNGPMPTRGTDDVNTVFQLEAGLKGVIPKIGWTWSVNGSHSESNEYSVAQGDFSLLRFQTLITAPNYGKGVFQGNYTQPDGKGGTIASPNNGFGASTVTCTSGFQDALFNGGAPSKDCLNAMAAPVQSTNLTYQDVVEFDASGDIFKLPAGTLKGSIGADYRRDSLIFNPDILASNQTFTDQVIGVYPTAYSNVSQDAREVYGELSIPVLADLPFVKEFTFNPGVRYSSYNTSKGGWTYKLLGDWQLNDYVRFRGGYNLAVRAPNLGELFQGPSEVFGAGTNYGDPCSLLSKAPFGAGGAGIAQGQSAPTAVANSGGLAGAQKALAICKQLMGPAGATYFYTDPAATQPNPGPSPFAWTNTEGNPNLLPETAKTYTAGAVLRSPFQNPLFSRAQLSIDYYKIHIDDAIEFASIDYTYQQCLESPTLAAAAASVYCQAAVRNVQFGSQMITTTPAANLATIDTSGVDLQLDWQFALADLKSSLPGRVSLNVTSTFLGNYDTIAGPGQAPQKWYGTLGPNLTGTNGGSFAYRLNTTFGYSIGGTYLSLNWRHFPQINAATAVAPGNLVLPTKAYDIFDLNTSFDLPHKLTLRFGIQNLFDADPPTTAAKQAQYVNGVMTGVASDGQGTTNPAFYDPLGRRFYIGLKARF
jgi:outer membrane receptor protein involved in Fe transport